MLIIAITFILLFNSVFSTELDFILKDTGLAASKKSSIILKDSILPNNYQVGPGDEFFINVVSNNLSINEYLVISPLGDIVLPHIGVLNIDKVYISDAFDLIEDKYSNKFDNISMINNKHFSCFFPYRNIFFTISNIIKYRVIKFSINISAKRNFRI